MKKLFLPFAAIAIVLVSSSCGINHAFVLNQNQNSTQVHLTTNNYQVVEKVRGSADVTYVFIFGGMNKKQLYANAYAEMMEKANLSSGSRALVNMVTEEHTGGVPPFFYKRTVTVSAQVIEFTR